MTRTNNEVVTEAFALARSNGGRLTYLDFQRLWHEMNDNLVAQGIPEQHRQNLLTSLEMFAEPTWLDLVPPRPVAKEPANKERRSA